MPHALQCLAVATTCNTGLPASSGNMQRHGDRAADTARRAAADALYGFTGAQASNLQSVALADSCLALGAKVGPYTFEQATVPIPHGKEPHQRVCAVLAEVHMNGLTCWRIRSLHS